MDEEKLICPSCGAENRQDAHFCQRCGTNLAADVQPDAAQPADGAVGPAHVAEVAAAEAPATARQATRRLSPGRAKEIRAYVCAGGAIVAALFSLVFVLCIGLTMSAQGQSASSMNIYYYFSDFFREIDALKTTTDDGLLIAAYYVRGSMGIAISAATIVSVVVISLIVIMRGAIAVQKKDIALVPVNLAAASVFGYVGGACALLLLEYGCANMSYSALLSIEMSVAFNAPTIVGIVFSLLGLLVCLGVRGYEQRADILSRRSLANTAGAIAALVLAFVLLIICGNTFYSSQILAEGISISYSMSGMQIYFFHNSFIGGAFASAYAGDYLNMLIFSSIGYAAVVAVLVCTVIYAARSVNGAFGAKKSAVVVPVLIAAFAVVGLVCSIVVGNINDGLFAKYALSGMTGGNVSYGGAIALVVVAAVVVAVAFILRSVAKKNEGRAEGSAAQAPEEETAV